MYEFELEFFELIRAYQKKVPKLPKCTFATLGRLVRTGRRGKRSAVLKRPGGCRRRHLAAMAVLEHKFTTL